VGFDCAWQGGKLATLRQVFRLMELMPIRRRGWQLFAGLRLGSEQFGQEKSGPSQRDNPLF
jgi:hypothetical protein